MKAILELTKPDAIEVKTPLTRLLDLLAGWSEYVQTEENAVSDQQVSIQELCDLYQRAGLLMQEEYTPDQEERAVRDFVEAHMMPLLLKR